MRAPFLFLIIIFVMFAYGTYTGAQASIQNIFTENLSLGSRDTRVITLQKILNSDLDTRVASVGAGSRGNETDYFGPLTKNAVIRFQEKYAKEVLVPVGLLQGTGYVGFYTRAKLNSISSLKVSSENPPTPAPIAVPSSTNYLVKDNEKIDIYVGDRMIANVQERILTAINSAIASQSTATATMPVITPADVPSVVIQPLSPRSGAVGTKISVTGFGISSNSKIYLGNTYIVRAVNQDILGNVSFVVPPIPPGRYDIAVQTDSHVSNTTTFVITDPKNPLVYIQNISPTMITYGGILTISGSGFSPKDNVVVTTYQKFTNVSSSDGKTLTVQLAPENLQELARVGLGTDTIPISVYVVNEYGFSNSEKSIIIVL